MLDKDIQAHHEGAPNREPLANPQGILNSNNDNDDNNNDNNENRLYDV